jgi:hypothetical protein
MVALLLGIVILLEKSRIAKPLKQLCPAPPGRWYMKATFFPGQQRRPSGSIAPPVIRHSSAIRALSVAEGIVRFHAALREMTARRGLRDEIKMEKPSLPPRGYRIP